MQCKQSAILFYQFCLPACLPVCLSVCPSIQSWYCVKINGHVVAFLTVWQSHHSSLSRHRRRYTVSRRTHSAVVEWNSNRKSGVAYRSPSVPMTLSDLERRNGKGRNFLADLHSYALTVWPRMTEFGTLTQVGRNIFPEGQPRPHPNGVGPESQKCWDPYLCRNGFSHVPHLKIQGPIAPPKFLGRPLCAHTVWETTSNFLHGVQIRCNENFCGVDHECWRAICLRQLTFLLKVYKKKPPKFSFFLAKMLSLETRCLALTVSRQFFDEGRMETARSQHSTEMTENQTTRRPSKVVYALTSGSMATNEVSQANQL